MMQFRKIQSVLLLCLVGLWVSCNPSEKENKTNEVDELISEVKEQYAPDKRVAIFDVEAYKNGNSWVLKGSSNIPEAVTAFEEKIKAKGIQYVDSIERLPSADLDGKTQGIIALSAANLRGNPKHSAELVTQGTLGMPIKIYKKQGSWYLIQTPDQYIAWVDYGGVAPMDSTAFEQWQESKKLMYTKTFGSSFAEADRESQVISDLVAGNILNLQGMKGDFYEATYPDGRTAYIPKDEAAPYNEWIQSLEQTKERLVATSKTLMGVPYLWGGTSPKGVDCSGFTKTIYFLNGMIIPRDASQQIHEGTLIDDSKDFSKLQPGDLLFFGKKATDSTKERIIHVGMWIGNNEFIHSAGSVHISSMDKNAPNYDEYNYNRYLRTKRILNEDSDGLIDLREKEVF